MRFSRPRGVRRASRAPTSGRGVAVVRLAQTLYKDYTIPMELYRIQVAARLSGVPVGLIRQWERRYGILAKPDRRAGGYRLYGPEDVDLLRHLRLETERGISIREAAAQIPARLSPPSPRPSGGEERPEIEALIAAARAGSAARVDEVLDRLLAFSPAPEAFDRVLAPVLRSMGDLWRRGEVSVAHEHLLTEAIRGRLVALLRGAPRGGTSLALCACFEDEAHDLGLVGAALELRRRGCSVVFLGARTPAAALGVMARTLRPSFVALASVVDRGPARFRRALDAHLAELPTGTRLVVGGRAAERYADDVRERWPQAMVGLEGIRRDEHAVG